MTGPVVSGVTPGRVGAVGILLTPVVQPLSCVALQTASGRGASVIAGRINVAGVGSRISARAKPQRIGAQLPIGPSRSGRSGYCFLDEMVVERLTSPRPGQRIVSMPCSVMFVPDTAPLHQSRQNRLTVAAGTHSYRVNDVANCTVLYYSSTDVAALTARDTATARLELTKKLVAVLIAGTDELLHVLDTPSAENAIVPIQPPLRFGNAVPDTPIELLPPVWSAVTVIVPL